MRGPKNCVQPVTPVKITLAKLAERNRSMGGG